MKNQNNYRKYENFKNRLRTLNLTPYQYEQIVREASVLLGI